MRLALATVLLPAAAAAPTCTDASCCSTIAYGKCTGNTHAAPIGDADPVPSAGAANFDCATQTNAGSYADKATGNTIDLPAGTDAAAITAQIAACCDPVVCTASDCGTGFLLKATLPTLTAGVAPTQAACCDAVATCGDKDGAGALTAAVVAADCGAGWQVDAGAAAVKCAGLECDLTLESDKVACCTICPVFTFSAAGADCTATTVTSCSAGEEYTGGVGNTAVGATMCTACPTGKFNTDGAGACADQATACSVVTKYISTAATASADIICTDNTVTACAAGNQPKTTGAETVIAADAAAACEACPTGKWTAGVAAEMCADHSTCDALKYISTAGTTSADVVCSDCAAGKTSSAANSLTACTDITGYCEGNVDGDDDGTALDTYACPATKYVADNVQSAITTAAVAQGCTATAATGTAIGTPPLGPGDTDAVTSCALSVATCTTPAITAGGVGAPTGCDGAAGFTGSEASCTALTDSADTTCVWATGTCTKTGGGACAYTAEIGRAHV